jgi:hypothetical protein
LTQFLEIPELSLEHQELTKLRHTAFFEDVTQPSLPALGHVNVIEGVLTSGDAVTVVCDLQSIASILTSSVATLAASPHEASFQHWSSCIARCLALLQSCRIIMSTLNLMECNASDRPFLVARAIVQIATRTNLLLMHIFSLPISSSDTALARARSFCFTALKNSSTSEIPWQNMWNPPVLTRTVPSMSHSEEQLILSASVHRLPFAVTAGIHELVDFKSRVQRVALRSSIPAPDSLWLADFCHTSAWPLAQALMPFLSSQNSAVPSFQAYVNWADRIALFRLYDQICHAPQRLVSIALPQAQELFQFMWSSFRVESEIQDPLATVESAIHAYSSPGDADPQHLFPDNAFITPAQNLKLQPRNRRMPRESVPLLPTWAPSLGSGTFPLWLSQVSSPPLSWRCESLLYLIQKVPRSASVAEPVFSPVFFELQVIHWFVEFINSCVDSDCNSGFIGARGFRLERW